MWLPHPTSKANCCDMKSRETVSGWVCLVLGTGLYVSFGPWRQLRRDVLVFFCNQILQVTGAVAFLKNNLREIFFSIKLEPILLLFLLA